MQNGEHSTGGAADTAQGAAPAHAPAQAAGGTTAAGWLDRVALHGRTDAPSTHALRPRLPYPFEAMRFATADAGPRMPAPGALRTQPEEAAATPPRAGRTDDLATTPMIDPLRPAPTASAAIAPSAPAAAAPPAWQRHEAHPAAPARRDHRLEPAPAKEEHAPRHRETHAPLAAPSVAARP
ncbi:hypothetical protein GTP91_32155, partial [Rugamonas sp. FT82W]|nr:hypothetical protein [Duganella vulcania]